MRIKNVWRYLWFGLSDWKLVNLHKTKNLIKCLFQRYKSFIDQFTAISEHEKNVKYIFFKQNKSTSRKLCCISGKIFNFLHWRKKPNINYTAWKSYGFANRRWPNFLVLPQDILHNSYLEKIGKTFMKTRCFYNHIVTTLLMKL